MDDQQIHNALMAIKEDISSLKTEMKAVWKRMDDHAKLVDTVHELALSVRDLANTQQHHTDRITKIGQDLDEIKGKPAKRWETVVGIIISVVATSIITYFITTIGLK